MDSTDPVAKNLMDLLSKSRARIFTTRSRPDAESGGYMQCEELAYDDVTATPESPTHEKFVALSTSFLSAAV
jgi:hypothetical protein